MSVTLILFLVYYYFSFFREVDKVFITVSTFLFAIFAGFFISRQNTRYDKIRERVSNFDGHMSSMYRSFGHLGYDAQGRAGEVMKEHYDKILKHKAWDYHFMHKSSTITSLHELLQEVAKDEGFPSLKNQTVNSVLSSLREVQIIRKNMVSGYQERIPKFQLVLLYCLAAVLLFTISTIPSQYLLFNSVLKAIFGISVIIVIVLLHQLDQLKLFEGTVGENSARDLLEIIEGKK